MDVRPSGAKGSEKNDPEDPEAEISKAGRDGVFVFSGGSLLEGGNVRGGAMVIGKDGGEQEVECGIRDRGGWNGAKSRRAKGLSWQTHKQQ